MLRRHHARHGRAPATLRGAGIGRHISDRAAQGQIRGDRPGCRLGIRRRLHAGAVGNWLGRFDSLATVRSRESNAGRPGVHGDVLLPLAAQQAGRIRAAADAHDVADADVGAALSNEWLADGRHAQLFALRLWPFDHRPATLDDRRGGDRLAESARRARKTTTAVGRQAIGRRIVAVMAPITGHITPSLPSTEIAVRTARAIVTSRPMPPVILIQSGTRRTPVRSGRVAR